MNTGTAQQIAPATNRTTKSRPRSRRWLPYLAGIVLVGLIVAGLWPKPMLVELAQPTVGKLRETVNEDGKTRIKNRFVVSAPVTGQLRRISLKAGASVRGGETVVAIIDPITPALLDARSRSAAQARRDTAFANLEKAEAAHAFAAKELERFKKLFAEQTISIQELETVQLRETSAAREKAAAESSLRQAEAELAEFSGGLDKRTPENAQKAVEVKAPATGQVLYVLEENSKVVTAGTPLMQIGNPADLEAVIEVLSRDGAAIAPGMKVELEQWGGGVPLEARVRLVEPAAFTKVSALGVEEQRVNVVVDILTPGDQRPSLGDNFRVEARIVMWEMDQALKVPAGALFRRGDKWFTYVVADGRAMLRSVKVGRTSGTETQVLEGLKEGEQVVLYPGERLREGKRVKQLTI